MRGEIAHQILNEKPFPLSGGSHFVVSIMAGLSKKPESRPRSCSAVLGRENFTQKCGGAELRENGVVSKGNWTKKSLWAAGVIFVVVLGASFFGDVSEHSKKQATEQFLSFFGEGKYDAAAQLEGKIDVSNVQVQVSLGKMYLAGNGVRKNTAKGIMWTTKAAEQGDVFAQSFLAASYHDGVNGVIKNVATGVQWLRKAAEQGDLESQKILGMSYALGGHGVQEDRAEAIYWLRKVAEQGEVDAQSFLGDLLFLKGPCQDLKESVIWTRKAAMQGDAQSQERLGLMYFCGKGVMKDCAEAAKWLYKAAQQGCPKAQFSLGTCYLHGEGVNKDEKEAIIWYRKAAKQGNVEAQEKLRKNGLSW